MIVEIRARTPMKAPSHSPPDRRYAPGRGLARCLGWFSIGLGLAEVCEPDSMAELTGVHRPELLQLYGLREIACGLGILNSPQPAAWVWGRVVGDAIDLATLALADDRRRAGAAAIAVAGIAILDVICAGQLTVARALVGDSARDQFAD